MPHQAEPRAAGRHRPDRIRRHRAGLTAQLAGERSRTTVLTAALGAALVTGVGVAGGSAAAAAERQARLSSAAAKALPPQAAPKPADPAPGTDAPPADPTLGTGHPPADLAPGTAHSPADFTPGMGQPSADFASGTDYSLAAPLPAHVSDGVSAGSVH